MFSKSLVLFFALMVTNSSYTAEVDSFTRREIPLADSLDLINKKSNEFLSKAVNDANERKGFCQQKDLYKSMRKYFNNQYQGQLGKYIVETEDLDKNLVTIKESIYQDFKWYQSIIQGYWARKVTDPSAANLNVNGVIIGTDKFEHFMGSGYLYYKKNYIKGKGVLEAMEIGFSAETGFMGAITTGVKAYGDLSANFNGMRFWNHVLQNYDDVLGKEYNIGPYVVCQGNKWVQIKDMDWSDYIDHSFDEGLNCSGFPNKKMRGLVQSRMAALESKTGIKQTCPMDQEKIDSVIPKYGIFAKDLINAKGHSTLKKED